MSAELNSNSLHGFILLRPQKNLKTIWTLGWYSNLSFLLSKQGDLRVPLSSDVNLYIHSWAPQYILCSYAEGSQPDGTLSDYQRIPNPGCTEDSGHSDGQMRAIFS